MLEIAQIVKIKGIPVDPSVSVRFFGRYDDSAPKQKLAEENSAQLICDEVMAFCSMLEITFSTLFISVDCTYTARRRK